MADPFDPRYFGNVTQAWNPSIGEYGDDFGTPVGTTIAAPADGVIVAEEDKGTTNWGYRIFEKFNNGWTFAVGHVSKFLVPTGTHVAAGQAIALSGGAVTDPHGGHTTGPHIEPQLIDPSGAYHDPYGWLSGIFRSNGSIPAFPTGAGFHSPGTIPSGVGAGPPLGINPNGAPLNPNGNPFVSGGNGNLDLNPLDIPRGIYDHLVAPIGSGISHAFKGAVTNAEHFVIANVIALVVGVVIVLIVFGGSSGTSTNVTVVNPGRGAGAAGGGEGAAAGDGAAVAAV